MSLEIRAFPGGPIGTNAYLVMDTEARDAILVDAPSGITKDIADALDNDGLRLTQIVITHGHYDHIDGLADLQRQTSVPTVGHPGVRMRIEHPDAAPTPIPVTAATLSDTIDDGDTVTVGAFTFRVMHMPGHDTAHIILWCKEEAVILGGDVLFPDGHGRTDLPGSNQATMNATLRTFLTMDPATTVYPGHGTSTTLGREARWIRQIPSE